MSKCALGTGAESVTNGKVPLHKVPFWGQVSLRKLAAPHLGMCALGTGSPASLLGLCCFYGHSASSSFGHSGCTVMEIPEATEGAGVAMKTERQKQGRDKARSSQ